ncbi:hypothetical protein MKK70_21330 [Methylobacterium sp. E-041]|uniref:hypothetical protein n=1 Tax=Methylobacterium sp. E-041 TaxID=2836573 RepID=UPI001FBBFEB9|nr:hypothetical protein [Methylobacterium sp. E-041]MCJ2107872.1 hypothetical protein [Methylobacterium sp. E-041]
MTASASQSSSTTRSIRIATTTAERRRAKNGRLGPLTARDVNIEVGEASIADPYAMGSFRTGQVNRRVDVLATEHGAGRITESQFLVGRMIQAVFERWSGAKLGSGGWNPGGSRDQTIAHELQIIFAIEDAEKVKKFVGHLERAIGAVGVRFLRAILSEGQTFTTYAAARGKAGERGAAQIAGHFRLLLEGLVESQHTATGAGRAVPDDQYAARAREISAR